MKISKKTIYDIIVSVIAIGIGLTLIIVIFFNKRGDIDKCHKLTYGQITNIVNSRAGGMRFEYFIDKKVFIKTYPDLFVNELIGHRFPVVYSCTDTSWAFMMIHPKDFEKYGYGFPDSLKWILPLIK